MTSGKAADSTVKRDMGHRLTDIYKAILIASEASLSVRRVPNCFRTLTTDRLPRSKPARLPQYSPLVATTACALLIGLCSTAHAHLRSREHKVIETGTASFYGKWHQGKRTASGTRFDDRLLTAAHPWLPLGSRVKVTLMGTGRSVVVLINDRMPPRRRIVDLSLAAARELGMLHRGIARVKLTAR